MSSLTMDELSKALKELTYEHTVFSKRIEELMNLLEKGSNKNFINESLNFFEKALLPHREREEKFVFPSILKLKPDEKKLIEKLKEDHKSFLKRYESLKNLTNENEIIKEIKELLESFEIHRKDEEPLFQLILKEALKS